MSKAAENYPEVVHMNCQFCGKDIKRVVYCEEEWGVVKCLNCGFHYTNPRPLRRRLPEFYRANYFSDKRHSKKFFGKTGEKLISEVSYTNRINDVEHYMSERGRILEVGAAKGGFLAVLRARGWVVDGVEISEDAVKEAREDFNLELFCGELEAFESDKKYDVVCMYQTLEHVWNPAETLEKIYRLLRSGGILIIEVPNRKAFEMRYSPARRHLSYDLPRHLSHFTPEFLASESEKRGFEVLDIDRYHTPGVLRILGWLSSFRSKKEEATAESAGPMRGCPASVGFPMARKPRNARQRALATLAKVLPGWRFTSTFQKRC